MPESSSRARYRCFVQTLLRVRELLDCSSKMNWIRYRIFFFFTIGIFSVFFFSHVFVFVLLPFLFSPLVRALTLVSHGRPLSLPLPALLAQV